MTAHFHTTFTPALLTAILLGIAGCASNPPPLPPENAEQAVLAAERSILDRWAAGDPLGYGGLAADDVTFFDDIGAFRRLEGRDGLHEYLTSLDGKIRPHRYDLVDPRVQVYGDVAILTLRYESSSLDGEPGMPWKATSIYRWDGAEWLMVHAHWSRAQAPQPQQTP